jgi:predicted SAM-dependent methyltransferase
MGNNIKALHSAIKFIDDCFTIIKKGSIMRLAVPDLKLIAGYCLKGSKERVYFMRRLNE